MENPKENGHEESQRAWRAQGAGGNETTAITVWYRGNAGVEEERGREGEEDRHAVTMATRASREPRSMRPGDRGMPASIST